MKVLVIYGTRSGSTAEIAEAIGATIRTCEHNADIHNVRSKPIVLGYDAVILASPVRMGTWLPEMLTFIRDNQAQLAILPVYVVSIHLLNTDDNDTHTANRQQYIAPVLSLLPHATPVFFKGAINFSRLSWIERCISKLAGANEQDQRNWDSIQSWTKSIVQGGNI
ncbi:MAG: flavodoxin domain-containing protein [Termitinemataceae bacterium]